MIKPKIGISTAIFKGCNLGEEDSVGYQEDLIRECKKLGLEVVVAPDFISKSEIAEKVADLFIEEDVDLYIIHFGTFNDDFKLIPMILKVKKPVIIWAHDYSVFNISITGAQNVMPNIYDLGIDYKFIYGKFDDEVALNELYKYSRACAVRNRLQKSKIGYIGGHASIMTCQTIDEIAIKYIFGITLVNFGNEELIIGSKNIVVEESKKIWEEIKGLVGEVDVSEDLGIMTSSILAYILKIIKNH